MTTFGIISDLKSDSLGVINNPPRGYFKSIRTTLPINQHDVLFVNNIVSKTTNADLILEGNGSGEVCINDVLRVNEIESKSANTDLTLIGNGTGNVFVNDNLIVATNLSVDNNLVVGGIISSKIVDSDLILQGNGTGNVCINDQLQVDSVCSKSTNADLILKGNGTGGVCVQDDLLVDQLRVDTIVSQSADTDLTLEGNGTGSVCVNDDLLVDGTISSKNNSDLILQGNGTGDVCVNDNLRVDTVISKGVDTDLTLEGNGTGDVLVNNSSFTVSNLAGNSTLSLGIIDPNGTLTQRGYYTSQSFTTTFNNSVDSSDSVTVNVSRVGDNVILILYGGGNDNRFTFHISDVDETATATTLLPTIFRPPNSLLFEIASGDGTTDRYTTVIEISNTGELNLYGSVINDGELASLDSNTEYAFFGRGFSWITM